MGSSGFRRRLALGAGCAAVAVAAIAPGALAAPQFWGLEGDELSQIRRIETNDGKRYAAFRSRQIQFAEPAARRGNGLHLVGIDERPLNGELYGIGSNDIVYRINPRTGVATGAQGPTTPPFATGLDGSDFGIDFNPTSANGGAIRIVSDTNYNHRVNPNTGADAAGAPDGDLNGGIASPVITHAAYANSRLSPVQPATTTLFVLDSANDVIYVQDPPNAGTLTSPTQLSFDVTPDGGFDVTGPNGGNNVGYVATEAGKGTRLHRVNVSIDLGDSKGLGRIIDAGQLDGLAVQQR